MVIPNNFYDFGRFAVVPHSVYRPCAAVDAQLVGVAALVGKSKVARAGAKATWALGVHIDDVIVNTRRAGQGDAVYASMVVKFDDVV